MLINVYLNVQYFFSNYLKIKKRIIQKCASELTVTLGHRRANKEDRASLLHILQRLLQSDE